MYRLTEKGLDLLLPDRAAHPGSAQGMNAWPAGIALAGFVASRPWAGGTAVDLGAGTGVVGLQAAKAGLDVVLVERHPDVFGRLGPVIEANGVAANCSARLADWADLDGSYDNVFAADVCQDAAGIESLATCIARVWTGKGVCWVMDPGHAPFGRLGPALEQLGYKSSVLRRAGHRLLTLRRVRVVTDDVAGPVADRKATDTRVFSWTRPGATPIAPVVPLPDAGAPEGLLARAACPHDKVFLRRHAGQVRGSYAATCASCGQTVEAALAGASDGKLLVEWL